MILNYNGTEYNVEQITGDYFRLYNKDITIKFSAEWKNGSYFKIHTVSYGDKCYSSWRYHYKWLPLVREATYLIYKNNMLYDYTNQKFVEYKEVI